MCMAVRSSGRGTTAGFFVESSTSGAASSEASLSALGSPGREEGEWEGGRGWGGRRGREGTTSSLGRIVRSTSVSGLERTVEESCLPPAERPSREDILGGFRFPGPQEH